MLEVKNIRKVYKNEKSEDIQALNDVSFVFPETGLFFIAGRSGSGKTTFLDLLGGLDIADSGEIYYKGVNIKDLSTDDWEKIRQNEIGYIFQENNLFENMEIFENICLLEERNGPEEFTRIKSSMKTLGLEDIDLRRRANELSAGQKQRISILRALTHSAQMILADEPTENLDMATSRDIMNTFYGISRSKLVIVVTHDIDLAREFPSTLIVLENGKIIREEQVSGVLKSVTDLIITKTDAQSKAETTREIQANQIYSFLQESTHSHEDQFNIRIKKKDERPINTNREMADFDMKKDAHRVSAKSIIRFSLRFMNILN